MKLDRRLEVAPRSSSSRHFPRRQRRPQIHAREYSVRAPHACPSVCGGQSRKSCSSAPGTALHPGAVRAAQPAARNEAAHGAPQKWQPCTFQEPHFHSQISSAEYKDPARYSQGETACDLRSMKRASLEWRCLQAHLRKVWWPGANWAYVWVHCLSPFKCEALYCSPLKCSRADPATSRQIKLDVGLLIQMEDSRCGIGSSGLV